MRNLVGSIDPFLSLVSGEPIRSILASSFVLTVPNESLFPHAQGLNTLENGLATLTDGLFGSVQTITINQAPDLSSGKIWFGNDLNRPVEIIPDFVSQTLKKNYTYLGDASGKAIQSSLLIDTRIDIIQLRYRLNNLEPLLNSPFVLTSPDINLPHAQALKPLGAGMTKLNGEGIFSIAIPNTDYPSVSSVKHAQDTADTAKNAANAAQGTADSAVTGVTSLWLQLAPFDPILTPLPPFNIGSVVTGLLGSVGVLQAQIVTKESKVDHQADMDAVNKKIDDITGTEREIEVVHGEKIVVSFARNPVFKGEAMTVPVSHEMTIPLTAGMLRYRPNTP